MINHSTNQLGKVCRLGVKNTIFQKITVSLTSNQQVKLTTLTTLQQAAGSYNLIFGVGFALHNAVEEAAKEHSDLNYVLIDDVIKDQKNVASVTFADNESGYLAGVAAAKTTKTKQVGFVGGQESEVISRFEAGFKAGVASVDPSIKSPS